IVSIACASNPDARPQSPKPIVLSPPPIAATPPASAPKPTVDVGEIQCHPTYPSDTTALDGSTLGTAQVPMAELPPAGAGAWARFAPLGAKYRDSLADEQRQRDGINSRASGPSPEALQDLLAKHRARLTLQGPYVTARDAVRKALAPPTGKDIDAASAAALGW